MTRSERLASPKAKAAARAVVGLEHAATKSDITDLRAETKADIVLLRSDLRAALAELKAEIDRALWIQGGAIITILAGIGTLLKVWPS